jgi:hypothetical protein
MRPRFVSSLYPIQQSLDTRQNTSSSKYNEKTSVCYLTMIIFAGRQSDTSTALLGYLYEFMFKGYTSTEL